MRWQQINGSETQVRVNLLKAIRLVDLCSFALVVTLLLPNLAFGKALSAKTCDQADQLSDLQPILPPSAKCVANDPRCTKWGSGRIALVTEFLNHLKSGKPHGSFTHPQLKASVQDFVSTLRALIVSNEVIKKPPVRLKALLERAERIAAQPNVTYGQTIDLVREFLTQGELEYIRHSPGVVPQYIVEMNNMAAKSTVIFEMSTMPLEIEEFNAIGFLPHGPLGLTPQPLYVDGLNHSSIDFTFHDVFHGTQHWAAKKTDASGIESDVMSSFRCGCHAFKTIAKQPPDIQKAMHLLWFHAIHESGASMARPGEALSALRKAADTPIGQLEFITQISPVPDSYQKKAMLTAALAAFSANLGKLQNDCRSKERKEEEEKATAKKPSSVALPSSAAVSKQEGCSDAHDFPTPVPGFAKFAHGVNDALNSARSDEPTTSAWASVGDVLKEALIENSGKVEVVTAAAGLAAAAPVIQALRRAALASPSGHLRVAAAEASLLASYWDDWQDAVGGLRGITRYRVPSHPTYKMEDLKPLALKSPADRATFCSDSKNQPLCDYALVVEHALYQQRKLRTEPPVI